MASTSRKLQASRGLPGLLPDPVARDGGGRKRRRGRGLTSASRGDHPNPKAVRGYLDLMRSAAKAGAVQE